ncbi:MAG TPA: SMP-30/gluconolactonase/LRE family protein [Candidatus Binatia bacterium]|nr:SMP-30/gluconolactonase/LRE family protein [Candidatus Binatia bacterium]
MRRVLIAIAIVVVAIGGWFTWLLNAAGQFKTLTPHFNGTCTAVNGVIGAEDLTIHPRTGVAYISSSDRLATQAGQPAHGAIYAYDLNAPTPKPVNVTPDADPDFRPHGISLYVAPDGASTLFVINHTGGRHTIEIYDVGEGRLTHRTTLADPLLVSPNDLLAVTPTQVYVTNDHRYRSGVMRTIEDYGRRPWANVVMWDGTSFREVAAGISLANGINVSPDQQTVYVASTIGKLVQVYDRDARSGSLRRRGEIPMDSGVDNIEVDADGSLWIGSHPQIFSLVRYMGGRAPYAPSQILHVVPSRDGAARIDEVYLNLGEQISAASVGAVRGKRLLIGAIADSKILDCQMR